jgi:hypothetical protein
MAKLILFKKESCPFCIKFKESQNYNTLKEKLAADSETKDISFYEYEKKEDINGIENEIETAAKSKKIRGVPTLCLFNDGKKWDIIDIEVWENKKENKRDIENIFDNIKNTLKELKKADYKNKYIKYKVKYLELKNKYLQ